MYFIQHNLNLLSSDYSSFLQQSYVVLYTPYLRVGLSTSANPVKGPLTSPERLWIPRLALSRLQFAIFPSSALSRITAPYRGLFRTFSKRYGVQYAWVPLTPPAWHACSHFSVQSFCSNSLYIIFCVSVVLYSLHIFNYFAFSLSTKYRAPGLPHCTILRYKLIISIYRFTMFFSLQKSVYILCSMVGKNRRKQL